MDHMLAAGWALAFVMLFAMALRRSLLNVPIPLTTLAAVPRPGDPGDEDEQQPETDRAPRSFRWLPAAVGMMAALRLCLFVGWHH